MIPTAINGSTQALFTDNRFHNIGVGFKRIKGKEAETAAAFLKKKRGGADVDITVLTEANMSELGRFAVTENPTLSVASRVAASGHWA